MRQIGETADRRRYRPGKPFPNHFNSRDTLWRSADGDAIPRRDGLTVVPVEAPRSAQRVLPFHKRRAIVDQAGVTGGGRHGGPVRATLLIGRRGRGGRRRRRRRRRSRRWGRRRRGCRGWRWRRSRGGAGLPRDGDGVGDGGGAGSGVGYADAVGMRPRRGSREALRVARVGDDELPSAALRLLLIRVGQRQAGRRG